jgi:hypothetical protein
VDCCGTPAHEIIVQAGSTRMSLLRCGHCAQQVWTIDGRQVDRDVAFDQLANAYREIPVAAQAARDRTSAERQQRLDARRRQRAARAVAATAPQEEIRLADDSTELSELLQGWQVLGAAESVAV